jgi:hypothetical protein
MDQINEEFMRDFEGMAKATQGRWLLPIKDFSV